MRELSLGIAVLVVSSCSSDESDSREAAASKPAADERAAPTRGEPRFVFVDATAECGLAGFHQVNGTAEKPLILETVGGGVGLIDHDLDGDLDVYFTNGSALEGFAAGQEPADAFYVNEGRGRFVDATAKTGLGDRHWTCGVRVADYDGDGWPDLFLTNYGPDVLYRNRGDGTFEDVTERAGVGDAGWGTGACFLDHDHDGDLDLYVGNYIDLDPQDVLSKGLKEEYQGIQVMFGPRGLTGAMDRFYRNEGDGTFTDVTEAAGISGEALYSFQPVAFDYDLDGWIDVFVATDSQPKLLWRNLGDGRFEDVAFRAGVALSMNGNPQAGMGVAVGDYDRDLLVDLYVTNFAEDYNTMYKGDGKGFFRDVTSRLNLRAVTLPYVGWGCGFEDFDSDGDEDLYCVNGHVYPQVDQLALGTRYRQPSLFFENTGDGLLRVPPAGAGSGFELERAGRGSAVGDLDDDGDLDILIENIDDTPLYLRNDSPVQGNWVKVLLVGKDRNRDAIGARLVARVGEHRCLRLVGTSAGFLSSNDPRIHFGLGEADVLDELEITWPDGTLERFADLPAGTIVKIHQGMGIVSTTLLAGTS